MFFKKNIYYFIFNYCLFEEKKLPIALFSSTRFNFLYNIYVRFFIIILAEQGFYSQMAQTKMFT